MTATDAPSRSVAPPDHDRFGRLVQAEWTKLRTVRAWVVGLAAAAALTVLLALPTGTGEHSSCGDGPECAAPVGPEGGNVSDTFYFVRQPLTGDGSVTARVTSLTGIVPAVDAAGSQDEPPAMVDGVEPWAKAGLLLKQGTDQGSPYAAVMVTGSHGVRLQHNYVHDVAGSPAPTDGAAPRWLRLTRAGDLVTASESSDGARWSDIGTVRLPGLPATVEVGLFTASPDHVAVDQQLLGLDESSEPSRATGVFDNVAVDGEWGLGAWRGGQLGDDPVTAQLGAYEEAAGTFTISGSGDIAPMLQAAERSVERSLVGTFAGLIAVTVIAVLFITAEYRRGLIHVTFAASPRRGRVLAAKAVVIGATTFVVGVVGAFLALRLGTRMMRANGPGADPVSAFTEVRIVVGTAALLAVAAVLALAIGTVLRRSAAAVATVVLVIVAPYILATASILPEGPSEWLLRLTPAAAFSVQQTLVEHSQVTAFYAPANGYFPLAPWAGLAVLGGYTAVAMATATILLRRRDA